MKNMETRKEAVSESIGFIIIFGLAISGIGLIMLYGYPLLMRQESQANMRNMEQTMIVLQNDVKSLVYKMEHYKETSLRISGGTLTINPEAGVGGGFTILDSNGQPPKDSNGVAFQEPFQPGELRYLSTGDNAIITLENGAVIKKYLTTKGAVMLANPRWYLDVSSKTMVINLVNLFPQDNMAMSNTGIGTVVTRFQGVNQYQACSMYQPCSQVTIDYHTDAANLMTDGYDQAWRTYLTDPTGLNMTESPVNSNHYVSQGVVNKLMVKVYLITVKTL